MYPTAANGTIFNHAWSAQRTQLLFTSTQKFNFLIYDGSVQVDLTTSNTAPLNTWSHIAVVKNGSNYAVFINGVKDLNTATSVYNMADFNDNLTIGMAKDGSGNPGNYFTGNIDELRISKGIARWTSNFTPPSRAYGSNVKAENETTIKQEGTGSTKLTLGAPQVDGNTVALWHFEETGTTTGTYLYDSTSNHNDATTTGTTVVDGIFGKARSFNLDYASVASTGFPSGASSRTIMAWAKPNVSGGPNAYYVYAYGKNQSNGQVFGLSNNGGTWWFQGWGSGDLNSGVAVVPGKWIHTAVTYDGTTVRIYLDGKEVANGARTLNTVSNYFYISMCEHGCSSSTSGFVGLIDEMQVLNRALSPDEIASSTSIKDSSFSGKAITANGNARTSGVGKIGNSVYFDGSGSYLSVPDSADWDFVSDNFSTDFWIKLNSVASNQIFMDHSSAGTRFYFMYNTAYGLRVNYQDNVVNDNNPSGITTNNWYHVAVIRSGSNLNIYKNGVLVGGGSVSGGTTASGALYIGSETTLGSYINGYIDELRIIKGSALSADQIRQAYEYGLRSHQITIDFGASLQPSDLISSATDYNFSITATTSGLSATTSGLYLGDKIVIKENLGGTEYAAQGTVNSINTTTGAITVSSWDTGSTFPSGNGYSPNATVFKWQREYFDLGGAATTTRDAITNLTLRPTNGAEGRTIYLDDFRYNTNYLTASSSSSITSSNGRYMQYRVLFSSWDSFVSPYLSAINTLYASLSNMFPSLIGVSGGGFLSF